MRCVVNKSGGEFKPGDEQRFTQKSWNADEEVFGEKKPGICLFINLFTPPTKKTFTELKEASYLR